MAGDLGHIWAISGTLRGLSARPEGGAEAFVVARAEPRCRRCGGHFGHIFGDGPPPTGTRHRSNGVALLFAPAGA